MIAATGKYSLPLPLAEMTLATWLLGKSGIAIPDGRCTIAQVPAGQVDKTEGGWQLSGSLRDIPWADACDHIVVSISIRSEERRVGKGCVSTCRSRWSPSH